jgi:hypothetical protein
MSRFALPVTMAHTKMPGSLKKQTPFHHISILMLQKLIFRCTEISGRIFKMGCL